MEYLKNFKDSKCDVCGENHYMLTKDIVIGRSVFENVAEIIDKNGLPHDVLIVYDENSYTATDGGVTKNLKQNGFNVAEYIFKGSIHANEKGVGLLMFALDEKVSMIVGVGSGTICDLSRFCAYKLKIPFIICGTAPSMDGYASTVAAMTVDGVKTSFVTTYPDVIIGDIDILKNAPIDMVASGFGDIVGKTSALLDWKMGRIVTGEHYCEKIAQLTEDAVLKCFDAGGELMNRSEASISGLMEALTISGIAMQMNGNSRPASGSEHHISHFLEMTDEVTDRKGAYHGAKVGIASLITLRLYEKLFLGGVKELKQKPDEQMIIDKIKADYGSLSKDILSGIDSIYVDEKAMKDALMENSAMIISQVESFPQIRKKTEDILRACKGPVKPQDLGYSREKMYDTIVNARFIRNRFTILTALANWGLLEQYANEVLDEIY